MSSKNKRPNKRHHKTKWAYNNNVHYLSVFEMALGRNFPLTKSNKPALPRLESHDLTPKV